MTIYHSRTWDSDYVWLNGGWVTPADRTILLACAAAAGWGHLRLSQGGLRSPSRVSANTHVGLNAGDIAIDGRSKAKVWALAAALTRSGIDAFPRGFINDSFQNNKHIHWVSNPPTHAHPQARAQVAARARGRDGLRRNQPYTGPNVRPDTWNHSPYNPKNRRRPDPSRADNAAYVVTANGGLLGLDVNRHRKYLRKKGFRLRAVRQVYRWGRWNVVTGANTYYALAYLRKK